MKVIVSSHNSLGDGRYYDVESSSSFAFNHSTQVHQGRERRAMVADESTESQWISELCSGKQSLRSCVSSHPPLAELLTSHSKSLLKSLGTHVKEHYPSASYGVYPIEEDSKIAILVVANKYSPNNFWSVPSFPTKSPTLTKLGMDDGAPSTSTTPPPPPYPAVSKSTCTTTKMATSAS